MPVSITASTHLAFQWLRSNQDLNTEPAYRMQSISIDSGNCCLSLLAAACTRFSSNPRDKVYGIYSNLAEVGVYMPEPDYKKPVCEVYKEFTIAIIARLQNLDILTSEYLEFNVPDWPSWVPNLACNLYTDQRLPWPHPRLHYGSSQSHFPFSYSEDQLIIQGSVYGRIEKVGSMCPQCPRNVQDNIVEFVCWLLELYHTTGAFQALLDNSTSTLSQLLRRQTSVFSEGTMSSRISIITEVLRDIAIEFGLWIDSSKERLGQLRPALQHKICQWEESTTEAVKEIQQVINMSWWRTPFAAANGWRGTGCEGIDVDDLLVQLLGADKCVVLRRESDNYRFIGAVHSWNEGELGRSEECSITLV